MNYTGGWTAEQEWDYLFCLPTGYGLKGFFILYLFFGVSHPLAAQDTISLGESK